MTREELEEIIANAQAEIAHLDELEKEQEEAEGEPKEVGNADAQFHSNEQEEINSIKVEECNDMGCIPGDNNICNSRQTKCDLTYNETIMELLDEHVLLKVGDTCKGDELCTQD